MSRRTAIGCALAVGLLGLVLAGTAVAGLRVNTINSMPRGL